MLKVEKNTNFAETLLTWNCPYIYQSITDYLYVQCIDYVVYIGNTYVRYILCVKCVYSVFAIHYEYIVEVLGKTIRLTGMLDHSLERKFHGRAIGQVLQFSTDLYLTRYVIILRHRYSYFQKSEIFTINQKV